jgi:hypothetical protein
VRSIFRNEIDKMMSFFESLNSDFYGGYFAARVIVNKAATIALTNAIHENRPCVIFGND